MRPFALLALALSACAPEFVDQPWLVREPKVIAVIADPPEVRPGATAVFRVVVASPGGTVTGAQASWSLCTDPKPLTENGSVSTRCLEDHPASRQVGPEVTLQIGSNACSLFGPDTPPGSFRPRDPDPTGGYYQPVIVGLDGATSFGFERLLCDPAGVSNDVARDFAARYAPNANPVIARLSASIGGQGMAFERIPAGATVTLTLEWTAESAESFPLIDLQSLALADGRESLQASWFATTGQLSSARTGGSAGDLATTSDNTWTAPQSTGLAFLWAVLRDSRGGSAAWTQQVEVVP